MYKISRVIIFGDSCSDIGNMYNRALSNLPQVKLNDYGRFSDGKNWVDFFWESVGGELFYREDVKKTVEKSKKHLRLATGGSWPRGKMELANYAEGGATALHSSDGQDWGGWFASGVLSTLKDEVAKYMEDRKKDTSRVFADSQTLFIIWIGANDVVTVNRDPSAMPKVAEYVFETAQNLLNEASGSHVVIVGLPDPQFMPRFFDPKKDAEARKVDTNHRKKISTGASNFNNRLAQLVTAQVKIQHLFNKSTLEFFDIGQILTPKFLAKQGFAPFAQPDTFKPGDRVGKNVLKAPLLTYTDTALDEDFLYGTVSDKLHPSEGVYATIAEVLTSYFQKSCYFDFKP
ncbi:hypothetical protein D187_007582 [Cystobacter fuscus DSM 2262]|uniref:Phospholipase/lecithinase/hemolysin n=1 Tax=Cystobacter fuscus (strain ATCC 25194 / DSM 2262 / NBRC 100088 / M29) TaxID=1242864 RepID=S9NVM8_CYSF2|nr:SGNH/GDSL hydrolase family protein [Cystobacter fuscus]EPX56240.1 hypothetical protein D187_007582 [Cystobacter fuscus DSM 2262]